MLRRSGVPLFRRSRRPERGGGCDVRGDEPRVARDARDLVRGLPVLEFEPERVEAGNGSDAASVLELAAAVEHGQMKPPVVAAVAGRLDDSRNALAREVEFPRAVG